MTLGEFKTFLEGFEHAFVDGVPNAEQWALIKAKIDDVGLIKAVIPTPPFIPAIERNPNKWPPPPEPMKVRYSGPNVCKGILP